MRHGVEAMLRRLENPLYCCRCDHVQVQRPPVINAQGADENTKPTLAAHMRALPHVMGQGTVTNIAACLQCLHEGLELSVSPKTRHILKHDVCRLTHTYALQNREQDLPVNCCRSSTKAHSRPRLARVRYHPHVTVSTVCDMPPSQVPEVMQEQKVVLRTVHRNLLRLHGDFCSMILCTILTSSSIKVDSPLGCSTREVAHGGIPSPHSPPTNFSSTNVESHILVAQDPAHASFRSGCRPLHLPA